MGCWIKYKLEFLISDVVDVGVHPTLWVVGFESQLVMVSCTAATTFTITINVTITATGS